MDVVNILRGTYRVDDGGDVGEDGAHVEIKHRLILGHGPGTKVFKNYRQLVTCFQDLSVRASNEGLHEGS